MRDRVSWLLLLLQYVIPISKRDMSLWSSITSSDSHAYINEPTVKRILFDLWKRAMTTLMQETA
jgi:hypothetical protein